MKTVKIINKILANWKKVPVFSNFLASKHLHPNHKGYKLFCSIFLLLLNYSNFISCTPINDQPCKQPQSHLQLHR